MAKTNAVWGIDIGQSSLKALRCTLGADGETIVAGKYDYIEYPKILSQADADPEELVAEALQQFLSRNNVVGDTVAISVPGQAGLSRFFKPPPIELKKLPKVVEFEVKQQIPFPIEDVIWDWQQLGGSVDEDGRTVDAEIGLFAMKREAVFRALRPFDDADVEVDHVQLSPLSIFNVVCHDIIDELPDMDDFDPENPPESIVVMSMGTDTTDLIVTNGIKLWMRNIPIGGNHFSKHLSRELKLTQAKAEHLKRNARMAENPKEVFQAMRPVFNDLVNEVQRSLTFFQSMDKSATIKEIVLLGNAAKLPGLRQFLGRQLEIDVKKASEFKHLGGNEVIGQSSFDSNLLSFAPCYGLCLQGLNKGTIKTNLLPQEIVVERIIRAKKPWVLASVGALLLGCTLGWFYKDLAAWRVDKRYTDVNNVSWEDALGKVKAEKTKSGRYVSTDEEKKLNLERFNMVAAELTSASEDKAAWIEINTALRQAFPVDAKIQELLDAGATAIDPKEVPFDGREEIYIDHIETKFHKNLDEWLVQTMPIFVNQKTEKSTQLATATPTNVDDDFEDDEDLDDEEGSGSVLAEVEGWVIEIQAHHFHNEGMDSELDYVRRTLLKNLRDGEVTLPDGTYKYSDLGIMYPTVVRKSPKSSIKPIIIGSADQGAMMGGAGGKAGPGMGGMGGPGMGMGGPGMGGGSGLQDDNVLEAKEFVFILQMAWVPRSVGERAEAKRLRLEEAAAAQAAAAEAAAAAEEE